MSIFLKKTNGEPDYLIMSDDVCSHSEMDGGKKEAKIRLLNLVILYEGFTNAFKRGWYCPEM